MDKQTSNAAEKELQSNTHYLAWRVSKEQNKAHKKDVHRILAERSRLRHESIH